MSKVLSTLRQIAREWSVEGEEERQATYAPVMDDLMQAFPDENTRHLVRVFVPGAGLGRDLFFFLYIFELIILFPFLKNW